MFLAGFVSCDFLLERDPNRQEIVEEESSLPCGVEDPLNDLLWLKELKERMEKNMGVAGSQIIQYTYEGTTVFWVDQCFLCPDNLITVYNCMGQAVCQFGWISDLNTCPDFHDLVTDSTVLYTNIEL
jgi:hypothetical protein